MKAFVFERTGNPNDVLAVRELPEPKPGPGEILVRVRLSPVHPSDMHIMRRRSQVPDIKALCGDVVITSEDNDWGTQLATASEGKALSRAIDCVAGRTGETPSRLRMASRSRISASRIVRSLAVTSLPSDI